MSFFGGIKERNLVGLCSFKRRGGVNEHLPIADDLSPNKLRHSRKTNRHRPPHTDH